MKTSKVSTMQNVLPPLPRQYGEMLFDNKSISHTDRKEFSSVEKNKIMMFTD